MEEANADSEEKTDNHESSQGEDEVDETGKFKVPVISASEMQQKMKQIKPTATEPKQSTRSSESESTKKLSKTDVPVYVEPELVSLSELKSRALSKLSPAELLKEQQVSVPYREPLWSGTISDEYWMEVIKNGVVVEKIKLDKPFAVIGRSKFIDILLEHPTISRYHAVLQFRGQQGTSGGEERGLYLFDLGSTHGTFLNKARLSPNCYNRVRVGHVLKFGSSTRLFVIHGPEEDAPAPINHTITEIKAMNAETLRRKAEALAERERKAKEAAEGINWGFAEDAEEEDEDAINPFSIPEPSEQLDLDDPKKTLRGCFEREGYELEYQIETLEDSKNQHCCRIELPMIDGQDGKPVFAEVSNSGRKRDVQVQAAMEACRILDAHGILRASTHESREVKKKNWVANDFYDSDDDSFFDRTGAIEEKRQRRMKRLGAKKTADVVDTYESLNEKLLAAREELAKLEHAVASSKALSDQLSSLDTLDQYMAGVKQGAVDAATRRKMKIQMIDLKKEINRLERLVEIAKPLEIKLKSSSGSGQTSSQVGKLVLSSFGKAPIKRITKPVDKSTPESTSGNALMANAVELSDGEDDVEEIDSQKAKTSEKQDSVSSSQDITSLSENTKNMDDIKETKVADSTDAATGGNSHSTSKGVTPVGTAKAVTNSEKPLHESTEKEVKLKVVEKNDSTQPKPEVTKSERTDSKPTTSTEEAPAPKRRRREQKKKPVIDYDVESFGPELPKDEEITGPSQEEESESFSGWMPPQDGQSGDGKTKLNDLLGY